MPVDPEARVARSAILNGDVRIGAGSCVLDGAVLSDHGAPVIIGRETIVMEGAVLRGTPHHPVVIGDHVIVGPKAYLTGCTIGSRTFVATNASVFTGAVVEDDAEVRIGAIVHLRTRILSGTTVPIGWVAVGDPATILPPDRHDEIWSAMEPLDFPGFVFGVPRGSVDEPMVEITRRYARTLRGRLDG